MCGESGSNLWVGVRKQGNGSVPEQWAQVKEQGGVLVLVGSEECAVGVIKGVWAVI